MCAFVTPCKKRWAGLASLILGRAEAVVNTPTGQISSTSVVVGVLSWVIGAAWGLSCVRGGAQPRGGLVHMRVRSVAVQHTAPACPFRVQQPLNHMAK